VADYKAMATSKEIQLDDSDYKMKLKKQIEVYNDCSDVKGSMCQIRGISSTAMLMILKTNLVASLSSRFQHSLTRAMIVGLKPRYLLFRSVLRQISFLRQEHLAPFVDIGQQYGNIWESLNRRMSFKSISLFSLKKTRRNFVDFKSR